MPLSDRLWRVFREPRRVFESVADGGNWYDWVLPVLLVSMIWASHNWLAMPIVAPEEPATAQYWEQLSEEEQQMAARGLEVWRSHGWASLPAVTSFSTLAAVALVLLGVGRWILRGEITLRQTLAIKAYASLVTMPQWLLLSILVRVGGTSFTALSLTPAVLLDAPETTTIGKFLGGLGVFDIWQTVVLGIGLSVMTGQPQRRTILVLFVLWIAWTALGALAPIGGTGSVGPMP